MRKESERVKPNQSNSMKSEPANDDDDDDDLFGKSRSVSNASKSSFGRKTSQPPSLFGENDSDDDDLFGAGKSKSTLGAKAKLATPQTSTKSISTAKPSPAQSLFGDDDDDIFTTSSKTKKPPSNTSKKASAGKPKSHLKPSSEPFVDPLLGNMK